MNDEQRLGEGRFEPPTTGLEGRCGNSLSPDQATTRDPRGVRFSVSVRETTCRQPWWSLFAALESIRDIAYLSHLRIPWSELAACGSLAPWKFSISRSFERERRKSGLRFDGQVLTGLVECRADVRRGAREEKTRPQRKTFHPRTLLLTTS